MRRSTLFVALLFAVTAAFMMRHVAPDPAAMVQASAVEEATDEGWAKVGHADQQMVVAMVARNASLTFSDPGALRGYGQCFPFPASFTLGEHGFGEGVLAAVPWMLSGEPILAYNFMMAFGYFLAGLSMFLLVRQFTGDTGAGILAGLLLQWLPSRLVDGGHPFLHTEFWLAFALLFLHRLFVTGQVRMAVGVAFFLGMQALGSFYLILGVIPAILIYVPFLVLRHPGHRWRALFLTSLAGICVAGIGLWVLLPYLETRQSWPVLGGRETLLMPIQSFAPGNSAFSGWVFLLLLLVGLGDRFRGVRPRDGEDPRLPMLLVAVVILICSTHGLGIPGTSIVISSPLLALRGLVPGLDAVRALAVMATIAWVPLALIAGYGAAVIFEAVGRRARPLAFTVLVLGVALTRFVPSLAEGPFGRGLVVEGRDVRPPEDAIALIRAAAPKAVVHLPMSKAGPTNHGDWSTRELLLGSFAPSPTTSCYNSFSPPYAGQIGQLAARAPSVEALDALGALGIDTIVLHRIEGFENYWKWFREKWENSPEAQSRMRYLGGNEDLEVYRLVPQALVSSSETLLHRGVAWEQPWLEGESTKVKFWIRNRGRLVYSDPDNRGYREGAVMWLDEEGNPISRESVKFLFPLALAPGGRMGVEVEVQPPPGSETSLGYLSPAGGPWKGIGLARVRRVDAEEFEAGP